MAFDNFFDFEAKKPSHVIMRDGSPFPKAHAVSVLAQFELEVGKLHTPSQGFLNLLY